MSIYICKFIGIEKMLENECNKGQIHIFKEETSHYFKESSHAVQNSFKKKELLW